MENTLSGTGFSPHMNGRTASYKTPLLSISGKEEYIPRRVKLTFENLTPIIKTIGSSWFVIILVIGFSMSEMLLRKIILTNLYNYRWVFLQFLTIVISLVYYIVHKVKQNREEASKAALHDLSPTIKIVDATNIKLKLFCVGLLDYVTSLLLVISLSVVPGIFTVLIPQLMLPTTSLISYFQDRNAHLSLNTLFSWILSYCGVFIVCISVMFFTDLFECLRSPDLTTKELFSDILGNFFILLISILTASISVLWKRSILHNHDCTPYYLNAYTSTSQFVCGIFLIPVAFFVQTLFSNAHSMNFNIIGREFVGGLKCIFGAVNTFSEDTCDQHALYFLSFLYCICFFGMEFTVLSLLEKALSYPVPGLNKNDNKDLPESHFHQSYTLHGEEEEIDTNHYEIITINRSFVSQITLMIANFLTFFVFFSSSVQHSCDDVCINLNFIIILGFIIANVGFLLCQNPILVYESIHDEVCWKSLEIKDSVNTINEISNIHTLKRQSSNPLLYT